MATISQAPAALDIVAVKGDDLTITLTITENGVAYDWTGATVATSILDSSGTAVATNFTTTTSAGGILTLALTDANTTTLGVATYRWQVNVTKASATRTWLAGALSIMQPGWGGSSTLSASLSINTGAATIAIASATVGAAANITVADASNYYSGTDVESVLAEQATKFVNRTQALTGSQTVAITQTGATSELIGAINISDNIANPGTLLKITHFGAGNSEGYALDISNRPSASSAFTIHQYSNVGPAVQIDNTQSKAAIQIRNTENAVVDPGGFGTGDFFDLYGGSAGDTHRVMRLTSSLAFQAYDTTRPIMFSPQVAVVGLSVSQSFGAVGMSVTQNAGGAGFYVASFTGYDYGPRILTSQNSGVTLVVQKNGTGAGTVQQIINAGTGLSLDVRSSSASLFAITSAGIPQWVAAANQQTTVGAAGGASALPATPSKYLKVIDSAGTTYVIPAYAAT